jgi:hypothetical protein
MVEFLLRLMFSAVITMFIGAVGFLLALAFWRILTVKADREHVLRLDNLGNCRSVYTLTVGSPEPALKFSLLFNKKPLAEISLAEEEVDEAEMVPDKAANNQPQQAAPASSSAVDAASQSGRAVASGAGKIASFLGEIGSLLPGSAGRMLKERATQARSVQANSMRVSRAPQQLQRQASRFGKKSSRGGGAYAMATHSQGRNFSSIYMVQTPELESGQSISLTLKIGSQKRRYPQGSFPYTIEALPAAVDFHDAQAEPITRGGMAHFAPIDGWRYWMPGFSSVIMALLTLMALVYAYSLIWQF